MMEKKCGKFDPSDLVTDVTTLNMLSNGILNITLLTRRYNVAYWKMQCC